MACRVAYAQPVVAFTTNITQGCTPVEVQFSDLSTANPTQWLWDFGDGTTSTLKNPLKFFNTVGIFTVKLTVSNALGATTVTKTNLITAKAVPIAQFSATPTLGCFPVTANFTDLSTTAAAGPITVWNWDFGDGSPNSSLQNPTHTYTNFGDFYVSLYVANADGCASFLSKPDFLKVGDTVKADFDTTIQPNCKLPKTIQFLNQSAGSGTFLYNWDFGDGSFSTLPNPVHNYNSFGKFTVQLTATSSYGCAHTVTKTNLVTVDSMVTQFTFPTPVCINSPLQFSNGSAPASVASTWNFGNGNTSTRFNPSNVYSAPGNYNVVLINRFVNGCVDSVIKPLIVAANPAVSFSNSSPTTQCKAPLTVSFTNTTAGANQLLWHFGDGSTASGAAVSHTYSGSGSYSVKLVVTYVSGCQDSITKTNLVVVSPPKAIINNSMVGGCVPFTLAPIVAVTAVDAVTNYQWNFGDGFTTTGMSPSHTYTTVGVYVLQLIVTTAGGCSDTTAQTIRVGTQPIIGFTVTPIPACAKKPVSFIDTSPLGKAIYWDFGDGTTSSAQNDVHRYAIPGAYTLTMRVDNGGCTRDTVINNYILVLSPAANFTFTQDCSNKYLFNFTASAQGLVTDYNWDFGDGTTGTGATTSHLFSSKGNFTVKLYATNAPCTDTITQTVLAGISATNFKVNTNAGCRNSSFTYTAHYETPAYVSRYEWSFGDGITTAVTDSVVTHVYTQSGTYSVRLIVVNTFGCVDTVLKQNLIVITGAKAAFGVLNATGCTGQLVSFIDSTITDGVHAVTNWQWSFGDGTIQAYTAPPFTHAYTANGNYDVKLMVTDALGCKDSITINNAVKNSRPVVNFWASDTISCPLAPIRIIASGQALQPVYTWQTGIGSLSGDTAVVAYPDSGLYTIKLWVTDVNGCRDSVIKQNYISIKKPVAAFTLSDSISICPPLRVRFVNNSYFVNKQVWDFNNGNTSFQQNPFVAFPVGSYLVKLKVTSPGGCMDSIVKPIQVYPYTNQFTYQPLSGCQPLAVTFNLATPSKGTYRWEYNDGTFENTTDSFVVKKYTAFGPYLPRVLFTEAGTGCKVVASGVNVINVVGAKANFSISDSVFCQSGTVSFIDSAIATGPLTIRWVFGDGTNSVLQNPTHTYTAPGTYIAMQIATAGTCSDTLRKTILVKPKPTIFILGDSVGCMPFNTRFTPILLQPDTSTITWNWNFGNGQVSSLQNPSLQTYTAAGNFTVQLQTRASNGCMADTTKQIIVNPLPNIFAGNDTTVCVNVPVTLHPSGAASYRWLAPTNGQLSCINCQNPVATLASPSEWYYVEGSTTAGCKAIDSVHIQYLPAYAVSVAPLSDSLCVGQNVQLQASGAQLYSWTPTIGLSSSSIPNPLAAPVVSTTYQLVATDTLGCQTFTQAIPITVFPYPTVNAGLDVSISGGAATQLIAVASADAIFYRWTPTSGLNCTDCLTPIATPRATTNYAITVSNGGLCAATDSVTVNVLCSSSNVFIPNTFSPNGDGVNDVFYPRGTGLYRIKSFRIFNRWGEMVFGKTNMTPNDLSQGWDGTYKGSRALADVYTYLAEIYCDNNNLITTNGTINLIY